TPDNGLFVVRPGSQARIATYHIDKVNPANTQVKFELLSGVARSKSGDAVKQARQNFRFNTPVAAIGVRGTDFTVFTDDQTSRVAVLTGAVVVSGFSGGCSAEGVGPCQGAASRELSAAQRGQLLQVTRGQAAPQLLNGSPLSPDLVSPPRNDEPVAKSDGNGTGTPSLEGQKVATLTANDPLASKPPVVVPETPVPQQPQQPSTPQQPGTPQLPTTPELPSTPPLPDSGLIWGRWVQSGPYYPKIYLAQAMDNATLIATNGDYALLRTPGAAFVSPSSGSIGFSLSDSDAVVYTNYGYGSRTMAAATLANGALNVDFGSRSFATRFDVLTGNEVLPFQATGTVGGDGRLYGDESNARTGYLNVQGLLSNEKGGSASYIFDGRVDTMRTVNGATYWLKH
ncbi:MAG: FecR family protein, partial [Telluria sp.]